MKNYLKYSALVFSLLVCQAEAASTKLSGIASGGAYVTSTDQCVAVRNGNTDILATITLSDATISTTDITTNNVSTTKHGFAPKAPNDATKYLDGTGAYSVPAGGSGTTWPTTGSIVVSNSTTSPAGLAEVDGDCVLGAGGIWTAGACATTSGTITSTSANAFAVGRQGATTPVFNVDASTASVVGGLTLKGAATGGMNTLTVTDSGSNGGLSILTKGSGVLNVDGGTGGVNLRATGNTARLNISGSGAQLLLTPAATTSNTVHFLYTQPADTTLTASTEVFAEKWDNAAAARQHATGSLATQRDFIITGANDNFVGASTLTDGGTFSVQLKNCGTNGTCTNESGILIPSTAITGTITNSYGLNVAAATGATNNYSEKLAGTISVLPSATLPVVSSCGSGSLTTGSGDNKGSITSITAATACTITFGVPLSAAPSCVFSDSAGTAVGITSISTTAVTTTMTALTGSLYYICF